MDEARPLFGFELVVRRVENPEAAAPLVHYPPLRETRDLNVRETQTTAARTDWAAQVDDVAVLGLRPRDILLDELYLAVEKADPVTVLPFEPHWETLYRAPFDFLWVLWIAHGLLQQAWKNCGKWIEQSRLVAPVP